MEAAIAWLVQTILATLLIYKLDAWIRQVGLADDVEKLKSEVERVEMVIGDVRGRASRNRLLARSLARLKELLYDADDVIDELDYYRLQQQVQGGDDPESLPQAHQVDDALRGNAVKPLDDISSSRGVKKRKKWSKAWENFHVTEEDEDGKPLKAACKHCLTPIKCAAKDGTSGMLNHNKVCQKKPGASDQPPNPSSAGDSTETATPIAIADSSSRKGRREDEQSAQITVANTYALWDKDELSNRIQKITSQLQNVCEEVSRVLKLHGSDSTSSSNHHLNTTSDQHVRTSCLLSRKVYGRDAEKISIKNLILEDKSDGVRVLPIVGIAGVGKTALAQSVYNDPDVENQFQHKIWVSVSRNFDEVRLTREMLDFASQERHDGIGSFAKLQEILRGHANSKRLLIIFDDVWDDMKDCRWDKLLAPFVSGGSNGIVILVTTRNMSVAKRLGTLKKVKLSALEDDDFWLLFKSRAFGDLNYEGPRNLSTIGRKIAEKLEGNPLAAVSIGALLRENLTVDHWSNILEKEDWKSLELSEGIMPALKLSYDQLPYHLQQCFSYCSIFPNKHKFLGKDLIYIWISQGFVNITCIRKSLEETGWEYLTDLSNLGFFQQVVEEGKERDEEEQEYLDNKTWYSMCGLVHDFARMISRADCATIDGIRCNNMLPTIQHLSIVTGSAYSNYQHGKMPRNEKFEEKLRNTVTSVRKLRTLVLIGPYDSFFLQLFQDIFQKAHKLRLLQMSATIDGFNSFHLVNPAHIRYLKHGSSELVGNPPQVLNRLYHLQVLDIGSSTDPTIPDGFNNLVSVRHLVVHMQVGTSLSETKQVESFIMMKYRQELRELRDFQVQISSNFEITQLQFMNELVQLGVSGLGNVKSLEDAYGAGLKTKEHLKKLHLSWMKVTLSENEYVCDTRSESCAKTAKEVLEGLEPHKDLKHLQISRYNGTTSPAWLANNISVTSLQTLHLESCGEWEILPSLERFPCLTRLKLSNLRRVVKILVPSLEELVLVRMPMLERCSCTSAGGLNSSLRALQIEYCPELKAFDLFEIKQRSWLPGLMKLILRDCPYLKVSNPLPPSATCSELLISRVSTLPSMKESSSEKLYIGYPDEGEEKYYDYPFDKYSDNLSALDSTILAFHNLRSLKLMRIDGCRNLSSFSLEGFSHLVSLKSLEIRHCEKLFSSDKMAAATLEDANAANCKAFPHLECLTIYLCEIASKWLSLLLQHAPDLEKLHLEEVEEEEEENSQSNRTLPWEDSSSGKQDDALTGLARDRLVHIPLNLISSLKKVTIHHCSRLTFNWSEEGFSGFTSLQELNIWGHPELLSSLVRKDGNDDRENGGWLLPTSLEEFEISFNYTHKMLQPNLTSLKKLLVWSYRSLESLQLHSCTALEELTIRNCRSLTALEGLQYLGSLRRLEVSSCPGLHPCLESLSRQIWSRLEMLHISDPSILTTSFCERLTSLPCLKLQGLVRVTEEEGRALVLLKSLQDLEYWCSSDLVDLPAGLHLLPSLKRLKISLCGASRLPETGLPLSLEELEIYGCRKELADQCRLLATSKLNVKISRCTHRLLYVMLSTCFYTPNIYRWAASEVIMCHRS